MNLNRAQRIALSVVFVVVAVASALAQEKKVTQTAGVDNTRMGAYRALAQLAFQAFQKGDNAGAAELARILERAWDKGEGDLSKSNPDTWKQIDESMDVFIKPIITYSAKAPDPAKVQSAYESYLQKLKQAD